MKEAAEPTPEEMSFRDAVPGMWQWLALRRIAQSPCHGYELIRYFERLGWGGAPAASAVYPYLAKFLAEGFLSLKPLGRRKIYQITGAGEEHLRATAHPYFERVFSTTQPARPDDADFSEAAAHLTAALDFLKERGTARQRKSAAGILFRAADSLRRLSDGPESSRHSARAGTSSPFGGS